MIDIRLKKLFVKNVKLDKKSNKCVNCDIKFGNYFCEICVLYDNVDKKQYHCDKCKICRVGGRENFFHCDVCSCCLSINEKDNHKCLKNKTKDNCSICMENLFESIEPVSILKCGHPIHTNCMSEYMKSSYKCPLCSKSMVDMKHYFDMLDIEINNTPLPDEYKDKDVEILCNDCEQKSTVKFHFYGLKCKSCCSYNTTQI